MGLMALAALGLSVFLFFGWRRKGAELHTMRSTETVSAEHLHELARSMVEGLGRGTLSFYTEVQGRVVAEQPLSSELAEVSCVWWHMRVSREWEETVWVRDQQGRRQRKTHRGSEIVAENQRSEPFQVEDATGRVTIDPTSAEVLAETVLSRFETDLQRLRGRLGGELEGSDSPSGGTLPQLRLGRLDVGPLLETLAGAGGLAGLGGHGSGRRTLGYRFEERAIPMGREVYVLGEANDRAGELRLSAPPDGRRFLISTRNEAALTLELERSVRRYLVGSVVAGGLGAVLTLLWFGSTLLG